MRTDVLENLDYEIRLDEPTLDHYRHDWVPGPGVRLGGMWAPGVVTDADGHDFLGLRGWSDFVYGMTHTVSPFCGFRPLQKDLYETPGHLYEEYANHDWFEPYAYRDAGGRLELAYESGHLARDADGLHWSDADGRWDLHGRTVSKVFVLHVPEQDGIDHEVWYRHELLKAHGTVSGAAVEGYLHQDYCYGPPGLTYTQLPIARLLEGMWVSWIHELADGSVGGGCFWQGRGGLDFRPGYLLHDGETTAHKDVDATVTFNADAKATALDVGVGGHTFRFDFESVAGPLHYLGRLVSSSLAEQPVKSWCWIEYADGLLTPELLDLTTGPFELVWAR
jgi:hypothetical protein